ncbi:hypothetical protein DL1_08580 [Thioclava dalianensis]|uniref:Uncharacterized protein n=1 Tax=Thioclava dalianensis TaxID=1185766 RepID=A0A074TIH8_9RHOB|nr:hypothetical protein [Thioclava dalianensis]KEP68793.1 hypothetical protein DL1_08580 [Thioclava dalianensis]SFN49670.1 hypothetical protein SAMN05216224_10671 [Thioclava dalianensis]
MKRQKKYELVAQIKAILTRHNPRTTFPSLYTMTHDDAEHVLAAVEAIEAKNSRLERAIERIATPEAFYVATSKVDPETFARMTFATEIGAGHSIEQATNTAERETKRRFPLREAQMEKAATDEQVAVVKPLEWAPVDGDPDTLTAFDYTIMHDWHGYQVYRGAVCLGDPWPNLGKAQSFVQEDVEPRILHTIDFQPASAVRAAALGAAEAQRVDTIAMLDGEPEYHEMGMGCGLEDRDITDRYEAMRFGWEQAMERTFAEHINPAIEVLTTADDAAWLAKHDDEVIERCAKIIDKRADDYHREHGSCDPTTGVTEYPGNGDEWMEEWEELAEEIRASKKGATHGE